MCYKQVYKISSQYLHFWLCNCPKTRWRWSRHFFESHFLAFLIVAPQNKWHFWNPKTKTGQDRYVLKRNFWISKFDLFWPELDLTLGQIWKWVSSSNSTFQMTHKTCVTRYSCYIFMRWPHLTWPWPWPVLSISPLLTWHLRHPFSSILTGFELAAVSGLVSAADKGDTIRLWHLTWPWPDIWPC